MGFADSLRMQNIFPGNKIKLGYSGKLPDYYGSKDPVDDVVNRYRGLRDEEDRRGNFGQIADSVSQSQQQPQYQPPNIRYGGMTEYQQGSLAARAADRQSREANQEANREQSKERISISRFRAENPNGHFEIDEKGEIIMINPQTGAVSRTGTLSSEVPERERQGMIDRRQAQGIKDRFGNQQTLQDDQQKFREEQQQRGFDANWTAGEPRFDKDGKSMGTWQTNRATGQQRMVSQDSTRTTPPGAQQLQPSQQENATFNRIREVLARNPKWESFVNRDTGAIAPVSSGWLSKWGGNQLDEATRQQIYNEIYGTSTPNAVPPPATTPNPAITPVPSGNTQQVNPAISGPMAGQSQNMSSHAPTGYGPPAAPPTMNEVQDITQSVGRAIPLVPPEQRVVGQIYFFPNGTRAKWNGTKFLSVQ